jgi:hypothetical protein
MHGVTATFRNGRVELAKPVDWPDGTQLEVVPVGPTGDQRSHAESPMTTWPDGFFDQVREGWGDEPFERPPQGEFEVREDW